MVSGPGTGTQCSMGGYLLCNGCADTGNGWFQDQELVHSAVWVVTYFVMAVLTQ